MSVQRWRTVGLVAQSVVMTVVVLAVLRLTMVILGRTPESDPHGYVLLFGSMVAMVLAVIAGAGIVATVMWARSGNSSLSALVDLILLAIGLFIVRQRVDLLADGLIESLDITLWLGLLFVVGTLVVFVSIWKLRKHGRPTREPV